MVRSGSGTAAGLGPLKLTSKSPTHAPEIARHALKENWREWVERCEAEQWTVAELRGKPCEIPCAKSPLGIFRTGFQTIPDCRHSDPEFTGDLAQGHTIAAQGGDPV